MAVNWPSGVNTAAYNMTVSGAENIETVQFESGMVRTYQKDLRGKITASFSLSFADNGTSACQFRRFMDWYRNTLLSRAKTFYFPDLITHSELTEYRMTAEPSISGQKYKEVSFQVEEV